MQHTDFFDTPAWDELMEERHKRLNNVLCLVALDMAFSPNFNISIQSHDMVEARESDGLDTNPVKTAHLMISHWRQAKLVNYYQIRQLAQIIYPAARNDTNVRAVYTAMEIVKHVDLQLNLKSYCDIRNTASVRDTLFAGKVIYPGDDQHVRIVCETIHELQKQQMLDLTYLKKWILWPGSRSPLLLRVESIGIVQLEDDEELVDSLYAEEYLENFWYGSSFYYSVKPASHSAKMALQRCSGTLNEFIIVTDYIVESVDSSGRLLRGCGSFLFIMVKLTAKKKLKVASSVASRDQQQLMITRINDFTDAGMVVVVQSHTFRKVDRLLWAMSTPQACEFYERMPPSFLQDHDLLLKHKSVATQAYGMGKHLTKCVGISMGVYSHFKTSTLLALFFFRSNWWKKILMSPLNEGHYTTDLLKIIFYKVVYVSICEDHTSALATEFIRTTFLQAQSEAKDSSPAKTTFMEVMKEYHLQAEVVHTCGSMRCTCPHNENVEGEALCTCDITQLQSIGITVAGHNLLRMQHTDTCAPAEGRTEASLKKSFNLLFETALLSSDFYTLCENAATAKMQCYSDWLAITGYSGVTSVGDTGAHHPKDWPLMHNCARVMNMTTPTFHKCVNVEQYSDYIVNLGIGTHTQPRFLCYVTRDSTLLCAYMAYTEREAVEGTLRVLLYFTHYRLVWSLHLDPALSCAQERLETFSKLEEYRSDYPYESV